MQSDNINNNNITNGEYRHPRIYFHNMRSLNSEKFEELKLLSSNYDFLLLTESWLTKAKEKLYKIADFNVHYTHRVNRKGGGVAIYARNEFSCKVFQRYTNEHVSACWLLHRPLTLITLQ
jgi:hypothetical protein